MKQKIKKLLAIVMVTALVLGVLPSYTLDAVAATVKDGYEILIEPTTVFSYIYKAKEKGDYIHAYGSNNVLYTKSGEVLFQDANGLSIVNDDCIAFDYDSDNYGYCFYDGKGNLLFTTTYEDIDVLDQAHVVVAEYKYNEEDDYDERKYGIISATGEILVDCEYTYYAIYEQENKILMKDTSGMWYIMNYDGSGKTEFGKYTDLYTWDNEITAYKDISGADIYMRVKLDKTGTPISKPVYYGYDFVILESEEIILANQYNHGVVVCDYYLNEIEKYQDGYYDVELSESGLFWVSNAAGEAVYDWQGNLIVSTAEGKYNSLILTKFDDAIIAYSSQDEKYDVLNSKGEIMSQIDNGVSIYETLCKGSIVTKDENGCQMVDFHGNILQDMNDYVNFQYILEDDPDYSGLYFTAEDTEGNKWLFNYQGERLAMFSKYNEEGDEYIWSSELSNGTLVLGEEYSQICLGIDQDGKLIFSIEHCYGINKAYGIDDVQNGFICYNDSYDRFWLYSNDGDELISYEQGYSDISCLTNGGYLVKDQQGVYHILNQTLDNKITLGVFSYAEQTQRAETWPGILAENIIPEGDTWIYDYTLFSLDGEIIIPSVRGENMYYECLSETWFVYGGENANSMLYDEAGNKLCDFGKLSDVGYYEDGYLPYKTADGKWGVLKVSDGTHTTHTPKNTGVTKATFSANGKEADTVCSVCGATIATGKTIYAASNVSASSKVYNGKNQKTTVVVKDSKGNTISASEYTVSGTTKAKKVGTYNITITFKSGSQKYSGSKTITWQIKPKQTKITKITAGKKKITLKWSKQTSQTKGYKIQYSTSKNFTKNVKTITIKKNKTTSTTIKNLKSKKKYYVRICTYKGGCTSAWSKTKSIKVK